MITDNKKTKTLIILAGGKSSRMGTDKTFLEYNGRTFLQILLDEANKHFGRVIIAGGNKEHALKIYEYIKASGMRASAQPEILADKYDSIGPMGGLMSVFEQTRLKEFAVIAVDSPNASMQALACLLEKMQAADAKYDEMHPMTAKGYEKPRLRLVQPDESLEDILEEERKHAEEKDPAVAVMLSLDGEALAEACAAAYSRRAYELMKRAQETGEYGLFKALGADNIELVSASELKMQHQELKDADLEKAFANINCAEEYKKLMETHE